MHGFGASVEKFFGQKGHFFFEGLYQSVNRQALAPFFRQAVFWGLFPHFTNDARFINIEELAKLNIRIEDSATVIFIPPFFQALRRIARIGLVVFVLKKEALNSALGKHGTGQEYSG